MYGIGHVKVPVTAVQIDQRIRHHVFEVALHKRWQRFLLTTQSHQAYKFLSRSLAYLL